MFDRLLSRLSKSFAEKASIEKGEGDVSDKSPR